MKRKIFTLLLALAASVGTMFAEVYSGTCGDNLTWSLNTEDSTLVIEGSGKMKDYSDYSSFRAPWYYSGGLSYVKYISLPDELTYIGSLAFYECSNLTSIIIPNNVEVVQSEAFKYCSSLTSVTLGNKVKSIGWGTFYSCYNLSEITLPESLTYIDQYAFGNCSKLSEVIIPNNVTEIGAWAFSSCSGLKTVIIGDGLSDLGTEVFEYCSNLSTVTIGKNMTYLDERDFRGCNNITSVIWKAQNCNSYSFGSQVESFVFGDSVEVIPYSICSGMDKLTSITIPNSVTNIGSSAFSGCSGLTSVTIPNSVTSIGQSAFSGCSTLTSVIWNAKNCSSTSYYEYSPFYNIRSNITSFTFGEEVETIPGCLCYGMSKLISVTLPNTVRSIGAQAFYGCSGLTSITIPDSISSIGSSAFAKCSNLEVVYINNLAAWCKIEFGSAEANPLYYAHNLRVDNKKLTNLVIPDDVTRIGSYAFAGGTGITVVTIPESVTSIGAGAFQDCSNLVAVRCPNLEAWCNIEFGSSTANPIYYVHSLTANGSSLTELVVPESVTTIKNYAFYNCQKLTSATIGNGVTSIGNSAFSGCTGLTSAILGNSVESIGQSTFYDCYQLNSINIPNRVTSIGSSAFYYCRQLKEVHVNDIGAWCNIAFENNNANPLYTSNNSNILYLDSVKLTDLVIPEEIENISSYRFNKCTDLTSVTLPESMSSFESSAFNGCSKIQRLTLKAYAPPTGGPNSGITNTKCNLYVPEESVDIYSNAYWWEDFANIRAIGSAHFVNFVDWDKTVLSAQEVLVGDSAIAPANPNRTGYTFIGWDKDFSNITEDLTITALYKINTYRVEFVDWDGTLLKVDSVEYQSAATAPETPVREGYSFVGWDRDFSKVVEDLTITALYNKIYRVEFVDWDGTIIKVDSVEHGNEAVPPVNPTREEYTFVGWDKNFSNVTEDMTITALYYKDGEVITVRLHPHSCSDWENVYLWAWLSEDGVESSFSPFNRWPGIEITKGDDGWYSYTFEPSVKKVNIIWTNGYGDQTIDIKDVTASTCYYLDGQSGTKISVSILDCAEPSIKKEVIFKDWDGTIIKVDSVYIGQSATAPANPTRTGYNFIGWDNDFSRITEDLVVTAQYEMGESTNFTIYFVNGNDESDIFVHNVVLKVPAAPEIEGFTFLGWRPVASFIDSNTIEIEAVYEANELTSTSEVYTNPANPAQKLIRNGNVYILTGEKIYSITGQEVK